MPMPSQFKGKLSLPVIASPMFIVSYPELVLAECKAGIIGTFPSLNARQAETLDEWLTKISGELADYAAANPDKPVAPFGVNLIVHRSNSRLQGDVELERGQDGDGGVGAAGRGGVLMVVFCVEKLRAASPCEDGVAGLHVPPAAVLFL